MKIALVRTNNAAQIGEETRLYHPPLGLLSIAGSLLQAAPDHELRVIDMALEGLDGEGLTRRLEDWQPELIGLSALSCEASALEQAIAGLRNSMPDAATVVGGPHATMFGAEVMRDTGTDFMLVGEAELGMVDLVRCLTEGRDLAAVPGLAYRSRGELVLSPSAPPIADLDALPLPAWQLIDLEAYQRVDSFNVLLKQVPYAPILTSRGCPYRCSYCHNLFGRKVRYRSVDNVLAEIEALHLGYGVRELHIVDDIFNVNRTRALEILRRVAAAGWRLSIAFPNGLRADLIDEELLDAMQAAGVYAVAYAIETASPRLQALIEKRLDLERARASIEATHRRGIFTSGFFMLGFPSETPQEIDATVDFAVTSALDRAHFFTVVPHRGTALYELAQETYPELEPPQGGRESADYFAAAPYYQEATGLALTEVQDRAFRRFYLRRPWRLLRALAAVLMLWIRRARYRWRRALRPGQEPRTLEQEAMDDQAEVEAYEVLTRDHRDHDDDAIAARVASLMPSEGEVELLDVGCGTGRIAMRILAACPNVAITAVDLSSRMLATARLNVEREMPEALPRIQFVLADGKRLPWAEDRFDFGMSCYTLHHLAAPERLMREVARVTKPLGGLFFYDLQRRGGRLLELWVRIFTLGYSPALRALYRDSLRAALRYQEFVRAGSAAGASGLRYERVGWFDQLAVRPLR